LTKICQNVYLSGIQKDLEDISGGIDIFFNLVHKNCVRNLTSKLVRSTLTWPGTIRVRIPSSPDTSQ
jgi:hypothetical protein